MRNQLLQRRHCRPLMSLASPNCCWSWSCWGCGSGSWFAIKSSCEHEYGAASLRILGQPPAVDDVIESLMQTFEVHAGFRVAFRPDRPAVFLPTLRGMVRRGGSGGCDEPHAVIALDRVGGAVIGLELDAHEALLKCRVWSFPLTCTWPKAENPARSAIATSCWGCPAEGLYRDKAACGSGFSLGPS